MAHHQSRAGNPLTARAGRKSANWLVPVLFLVFCALGQGCVSKAKARAEAQAAFAAGQQQAMANLMQSQVQGPKVTFIGQVRNPILQWEPGLTLAHAIVAADLQGPTDPSEIFIFRQGRAIRIPAEQLLKGDDVPLEPGDIVQLGRQ